MSKKYYNQSKTMQERESKFDHRFWEVSLDQLNTEQFHFSQKLHYESHEEMTERLDRNERFDDVLAQVKAAMKDALTLQQLRVVKAYFFEGKTEQEISEEMGITRQVISQHLFGKSRNGKKVGGAIPKLRRVLAAESLQW